MVILWPAPWPALPHRGNPTRQGRSRIRPVKDALGRWRPDRPRPHSSPTLAEPPPAGNHKDLPRRKIRPHRSADPAKPRPHAAPARWIRNVLLCPAKDMTCTEAGPRLPGSAGSWPVGGGPGNAGRRGESGASWVARQLPRKGTSLRGEEGTLQGQCGGGGGGGDACGAGGVCRTRGSARGPPRAGARSGRGVQTHAPASSSGFSGGACRRHQGHSHL